MPAQIAPTINFLLYEKDLPQNNKKRRLFVIGKQILSNGRVDEKKEGQDIVDFEITEFDTNKVTDWTLVFNDCLYNYKSGNNRHCNMTLFWALYMTEWSKETLQQSLSTVSSDVARTAFYYIGTNLFAFSLNRQKVLINLLKELNPNLQPVEINEVEIALKEIIWKGYNSDVYYVYVFICKGNNSSMTLQEFGNRFQRKSSDKTLSDVRVDKNKSQRKEFDLEKTLMSFHKNYRK